jgi:hypothetical protein
MAKQTDTLALHYPVNPFSGLRSGAHPGKTFGLTKKQDAAFDPKKQKWSHIVPLTVSGIDELDAALVAIAADGKACLTRSEPLLSGKRAYRCTARSLKKDFTSRAANPDDTAIMDCPSVRGVPLHALPFDCDRWPNVMGLCPRTQAVEAWQWMLSVLGPEFTKVKVSAWWSSSCCVRPVFYEPLTLSARLWIWSDTPLDPAAAFAFFNSMDLKVKAYFKALHDDVSDTGYYQQPCLVFEPETKLVDPRLGLVSQRIYAVPPKFIGGAIDPLTPSTRHQLLPGKRALNLAAVMASLQSDKPARAPRVQKVGTKPAANRLPKARSQRNAPGQVVPLQAAAREIAAMHAAHKAAVSGTLSDYREARKLVFQERVVAEMVDLAILRGGLTEGNRNNSALMIASAVFAAASLTSTIAECRLRVRGHLVRIVDAEWIDTEWEGKGDSAIVDCFIAAQNGEKGMHGWDPRYTYFKASLLKYWQPTMDEVRQLGLMSLLSEAQRSQVRREAAKAKKALTETPEDAETRLLATEAHRLLATGISRRAVARAMGNLPITTVKRWLDAPIPVAPVTETITAAPVIVPAPVIIIAAPDAEIDAAVELLLTRGDDYADQLAMQLGFTVAQVQAAMHRLGHPELIRPVGLALAA